MELKIGDIIGYFPGYFREFPLALIMRLGAKLKCTHTMLYIGEGMIAEAGPKGIGTRKCPEIDGKLFRVFRLKTELSQAQQEAMLNIAHSYDGRKYAYYQALLLFFHKWFNIKFPDLNEDEVLNCSEFISRVYNNGAGIDLSPETADYTDPDDIVESNLVEEVK